MSIKAGRVGVNPSEVKSNGKLKTQQYTLPIAKSDVLGGVKPATKTEAMTQDVGVDANGALFTTPPAASASVKMTLLDDTSHNGSQFVLTVDTTLYDFIAVNMTWQSNIKAERTLIFPIKIGSGDNYVYPLCYNFATDTYIGWCGRNVSITSSNITFGATIEAKTTKSTGIGTTSANTAMGIITGIYGIKI